MRRTTAATAALAAIAALTLAGCGTDEPAASSKPAPAKTYSVDDCARTLFAQYDTSYEVPGSPEDQGCTTLSSSQYDKARAQAEEELDAQADAEAPELAPSDYEITLKVKSKQCFGSAGCSLEVEPELTAAGAAALDQAAEITYEISGDESGPIIETIELDEAGKYTTYPTSMSTRTSTQKPTAKITSVEASP